MLSRQALRKLRPTFTRVAVRSLATEAHNTSSSKNAQAFAYAGALLGLIGAGAGVALMEPQKMKSVAISRDPIPMEDPNTPPPRPELPTIPLEDVAEHNDESSLWFTFRGAVYDLTFFILGHPGGTPVSRKRRLRKCCIYPWDSLLMTFCSLYLSPTPFQFFF
jgi:cytochrome b involved in lipid metabolism